MPFKKELEIILNLQDELVHDVVEFQDFKIGYYIQKCKSKDTKNEDSLFIYAKDDNLLFGVSDGAGGHPKGADASQIASQNLVKYFKENHDSNFTEMIEKINDDVLALKAGAHATLSFAHIQGNLFRSHSVGDSEIIYWNSQGKEIYSNIPHSEIGYLIQSGALDQKESLDDPNRHLVTNLIGDSSIRIESASKIFLKKGHTIVIGSDGLFDNLSHEKLSMLISGGPFEDSFKQLCDICNTQDSKLWKKEDDLSFVVVRKIR